MALLYSGSVITLPHFVWLGSSSSGFVIHYAWKDLRSSIPCRINWEYEVFFGLLLAWWLSEPYWGFIEIGLSSSASVGKNPRQSLCIYKNLVFIWKGLCSGSTFDGRMIEWPNVNCSQIYRLHKLCMHRPQTQIWIVSIHIKALQRKPISRQFNSNNLREFPRSKLWLKLTQLEPRQCHRLTICFIYIWFDNQVLLWDDQACLVLVYLYNFYTLAVTSPSSLVSRCCQPKMI